MSALFRGVTSKQVGDFYCLNCPRSYRAEKKFSFDATKNKLVIEVKIVWKGFVRIWKNMEQKYSIMTKKNEMIRLTDEEDKSYKKQKLC